MKRELYYAVSGTGQGLVFIEPPVRDEHFRTWVGEIMQCYSSLVSELESEGLILPRIKWKDEPITITIKIELNV